MDHFRVGIQHRQQLLKVNAGHRGSEIDAGTPQAQIDSQAWIHITTIDPAGPINLCRDKAMERYITDSDDAD